MSSFIVSILCLKEGPTIGRQVLLTEHATLRGARNYLAISEVPNAIEHLILDDRNEIVYCWQAAENLWQKARLRRPPIYAYDQREYLAQGARR